MPSKAILKFLERHYIGRIALVGHQRPDGDAIGSSVGLAHMLRSAGFAADVVNVVPVPSNLEFLLSDIVVCHESPDWGEKYACIGILDCGELGRVSELNREAAKTLPSFNIDHHVSSRGAGDVSWVDPDASSTGEMVVRLGKLAGWQMTAAAAQALWTAIVTDTGRFSYENTGVAALGAAMECLSAGASPHVVAAHVYQSVTLAERQLQSLVLSRAEFRENGKLAVSWLRRSDFEEAGIGMEGVQDFISLLRETKGVEVAIFFYELGADVKVSMRTASPYNAIDIVEEFGGGGHMRAAGCSLSASLDDARTIVIEAVKKAFFKGA